MECVSREAKRLKESGVNIIIALSHSGYEDYDIEIAQKVPELSLIVGSHSHSFFHNPPGEKG